MLMNDGFAEKPTNCSFSVLLMKHLCFFFEWSSDCLALFPSISVHLIGDHCQSIECKWHSAGKCITHARTHSQQQSELNSFWQKTMSPFLTFASHHTVLHWPCVLAVHFVLLLLLQSQNIERQRKEKNRHTHTQNRCQQILLQTNICLLLIYAL